MTLELQPGESRGYWKYHVPGKHFTQAKANGKINNVRTVVLLDSGSEVSIIDATFARKVGCYIDTSQWQKCLGIGEKLYVATGRTKIKLTLAGSLVYLYEVWVGDDLPPDYQAILGMDFMVPAGIRLDLGDGSMCLPDEIRVMLHGRRQIFSDKARPVCVGEHLTVGVAGSVELPLRLREADHEKIWLTRGRSWVPTLMKGPGRLRYLHITNLSNQKLILQRDVQVGLQLSGDHVPRQPGFVSVGSRRYAEWQTLAGEPPRTLRPQQPLHILPGTMGQQSTGWNTPHRDGSSPDPKRSSPPNVEMRSGMGDEQSRHVLPGAVRRQPKRYRTRDWEETQLTKRSV
ncbi:hypothetical protein PF002_g6907 [Phytophthora fragariae]|uniref:Peptidase A2 domain-containing protein n=1 Tax=Phytophthora fragariae TaxID=53985 RepID=A0A6A4A050_9STRA|nr:hypothetical protein PF002_g6907 [Phytophthora fragariae]